MLIFLVAFLFALAWWWLREHCKSQVIISMQELVVKTKEYDLDTQAGIVVCKGSDISIQCSTLSCKSGWVVQPMSKTSFLQKRGEGIVSLPHDILAPPDTLNYLLRNVQVLNEDKCVIHAKLKIDKIRNLGLEDIFYVIVQLCESRLAQKHALHIPENLP
jgi:hypothetical protein